jgi:xanthine dehydrogenase YagT iron-sulfur-binding subunit
VRRGARLRFAEDIDAGSELQFLFFTIAVIFLSVMEAPVDDLPVKPDKKPKQRKEEQDKEPSASGASSLSRRDFLKISGVTAAAPLVAHAGALTAIEDDVAVQGPGKTPVTLSVNGKKLSASLEPRVTLLDALRDQFDLTGAKRVCDRGTCGACTVLLDGKAVYSCSVLAIDVQGRQIMTVEGLGEPGKLHPIQQAFVDNDAQQCGFCTPGFVVATKAFLNQHPNPTPEQIKHGLGGNFCRCGTYAGIRAAVAQAAKTGKGV